MAVLSLWGTVSNTRHPSKSLWAKPFRSARLRRRLRVVTLSPNCIVAMRAAPGGSVMPSREEEEGSMAVSISDRRDVFRRQRSETSEIAVDYPARLPPTTGAVDSVKVMIDQISGASVTEIERLVAELSSVRDMLHNEAERVQRQVADHASASQAAMTSMKVIADSLADWKSRNSHGRP
jgi:hypothetical protein